MSEKDVSVVNFHEYNNSNSAWSIEQMLEDALKEVRANPDLWNKATVFLLNDKGDNYQITWWARALKYSEIVLLCNRVEFLFNSKWIEVANG